MKMKIDATELLQLVWRLNGISEQAAHRSRKNTLRDYTRKPLPPHAEFLYDLHFLSVQEMALKWKDAVLVLPNGAEQAFSCVSNFNI